MSGVIVLTRHSDLDLDFKDMVKQAFQEFYLKNMCMQYQIIQKYLSRVILTWHWPWPRFQGHIKDIVTSLEILAWRICACNMKAIKVVHKRFQDHLDLKVTLRSCQDFDLTTCVGNMKAIRTVYQNLPNLQGSQRFQGHLYFKVKKSHEGDGWIHTGFWTQEHVYAIWQ